jgi:uncharacterized membrane protein YphA (DoxX/SURF4 family)
MEGMMANKTKFQISELTKEKIVIAIRWICMALFVYAAYAKVVDHERFLKGLTRVHIINGYAYIISMAVPIVEIIIAILLLIPRTAKIGLYSFTATMAVFTIYIINALIWEKNLPCLCGGAIEKLSWTQHIWLNLAFILIAMLAIRLLNLVTSSLKN